MGLIRKLYNFPEKKKSEPEPTPATEERKPLSEQEINEEHFRLYLGKYLRIKFPVMTKWEFADEYKLWHYDDIIVTVIITFPTGDHMNEKVKVAEVYKLRAAMQFQSWQEQEKLNKEKEEPVKATKSPALKWFEDHLDELAKAKTKAQVNGQARFAYKVDGLAKEQLLELCSIYAERTGYSVELSDVPNTIFVLFED